MQQQFEANDHRQGITAQSPIEYLGGTIFFGALFIIFTLVQAEATRDAILGFLQNRIVVSPSMSPTDVLKLMNDSLDHNLTIATVISWGVQAIIIMNAFPSDRAFLIGHRMHSAATTASMEQSVWIRYRMKVFISRLLIVLDVVTDMMFAAQGHTLFSGFTMKIIPLISDPGAILVAIMYPLAVCAMTVFSGPEAFRRLDGLIAAITKEWHRVQKEKATTGVK